MRFSKLCLSLCISFGKTICTQNLVGFEHFDNNFATDLLIGTFTGQKKMVKHRKNIKTCIFHAGWMVWDGVLAAYIGMYSSVGLSDVI